MDTKYKFRKVIYKGIFLICANFLSMAVYIPINNVNFEASAIKLIQIFHFIAASIDTTYGLAIVDSLNKLFLIRVRNKRTPLPRCFGKVTDIQKWAIVSLLQHNLLLSLLHGPVTLVLYCADKFSVHRKVGIHIADYPFLQNDASGLQRPMGFTGANIIKQDFFKIKEYQS